MEEPKVEKEFSNFDNYWSINSKKMDMIILSEKSLLPYVFNVSKNTFKRNSHNQSLIKRPDKNEFLDCVMFGAIVHEKIINNRAKFQSHKRIIRDHLGQF